MRTDRNLESVSLRLLLLALSLSLPAHSATLFVSPDGSGTDGLSWETAFNSVQEGILAAGSGDQVWVKSATYVENVTIEESISLLGGFGGNENAASERDLVSNTTILDGSRAGAVIKVIAGADCRIDGFHITKGAGSIGGGVAIVEASAEIRDCNVYDNRVDENLGRGGGIGLENGFLILIDSSIWGNFSHEGGGVSIGDSNAVVTRSEISANKTSGRGGGVSIRKSTAQISTCDMHENEAADSGGGIYYRDSEVAVTHCNFRTNEAFFGGGVYSSIDLFIVNG